MKKNVFILLTFLMVGFLGLAQSNVIEPELQTIMIQKTDDYIDINIVFKSQMPTEDLLSLSFRSDNKEVRRELVVNELKQFAEQSQRDVLTFIQAEARDRKVTDIKSHWLVNSINCKATRDVIYQLASHPDIEIIGYDKEEIVASDDDFQEYLPTRESKTALQHITHINADKAWRLGYTGKGVVVAIIDTGVNYDHLDLKDHLWKDASNSYPGYNFLNPGTAPSDDKGHGTHCAGVVGGDGTSGTTTGIAPDATLMCLKVNSSTVNAQLSTVVAAVEYAVEKGADVISISKNGWANNDAHITFRNLFNTTLNAGIITVVSAGNYRADLSTDFPVPGNVMAPANCPPPWLHPDQTLIGGVSGVMCIGSVGYDNNIAAFSSQGPVTWEGVSGYNDYAYNNGASMGLIRPDLVAPGENIVTLSNTNNGTVTTMGTSISTPIVAGVVALMLEKNPDLTPAEICRILENTATKLTDKKSNDYGSGCVDALAAVQYTEFNTDDANVNLYSFPETINAKQNTNFSVTLINNGNGMGSGNVSISTTDGNITVNNATATYNGLTSGQTTTVNLNMSVNSNTPDQHIAPITITINGKAFNVEVTISNELVPPTNITAQVEGTSVRLSWEETNNATSYNIYRDETLVANVTSTTYLDENLEYGTLYNYTITSKRNELESEHSKIVRAQTIDNPESPSPTNVTATINNNNVNISWINANGSKASNIYRKDYISGDETKIASEVNGSTYTDNTWNLLQNGIYQYGVANAYAKKEVIYEENFENIYLTNNTTIYEVMNAYWYYYNVNGNYTWTLAESFKSINTYDSYDGQSAFIKSLYNNANYLTYLVSRQIDLTQRNDNTMKMSFRYITPAWGSDVNTLKVMVSTNSYTGPWTEVWSSNKTDVSDWAEAEVDLSSYVNQKFYIAFVNVAGYGYCSGVDNVSIFTESNSESRIEWSNNVSKNVNMFIADGDWSNANNWAIKRLPNTSDEQIIINANATISSGDIEVNSLKINKGKSLTLNSDVTLTVNNDFINTDIEAFIINDGAQVFQNNDDVSATFNMNIINPSEWSYENITGWQFISSPVKGATIDDFTPVESDYDLYRYDGSKDLEWINYKDNNVNEAIAFQQGVAYMASYQSETKAAFKGTLNHEASYEYELTYSADKDITNFHLLGNPFSFNMNWNELVRENIAGGYAVVNEDGGYDYYSSGTIKVGDGFFVKAVRENPMVSYSTSKVQRGMETEDLFINLIATGKAGSDNVVINLGGAEDIGFPKMNNFNKSIADIYVENNDKRYGVYNFDEDVKEVDVSFEAKEIGNYTISLETRGEFESVILHDRFTGEKTNMLLEDYNFTATSRDDCNRFVVKFKSNSQEPTANSHFVYQYGEDLVVNAEGAVQIIDMMGRVIYNSVLNSENPRIDVGGFAKVAYVVRLINADGIKTQKIILK